MKSALEHRLGAAGWEKLKEHCGRRVDALLLARQSDAYFTRRVKAEKEMEGDFAHRLSANPDEVQTVFDTENISAQLIRSVHRFLHARISKDFFGSEPWLSAQPEGPLDETIAPKVQKHVTWKLRNSNWKQSAKQAIGEALNLGEIAIKTTFRREEDFSERLATILLRPVAQAQPMEIPAPEAQEGDLEAEVETATAEEPTPSDTDADGSGEAADGQDQGYAPVLDANGDYIYDTDDSQQAPVASDDQQPSNVIQFPGKLDAAGAPITIMPGDKFGEWIVEDAVVEYQNVDARPVYWKDVLWELNAGSIDESNFVSHTYDSMLEDLAWRFNRDGDNTRVAAVLEALHGTTSDPKAEAGKPREANREAGQPLEPDVTTVRVTECYLPWRAIGGKPSKVYAVLVGDAKEMIWCDYLASISPRGQCPIDLVAFNRVPGRAYGRGLYEIYEMASDIVDRCISGVIARNRQNANPTKIWNPHLTKEGEDDPNLKHSIGQTYAAKDANTKASDILTYIGMPDLDTRTWNLVEFFMQLIQVESGATNANQGDVSSLPSNLTATGINSMLESSSVLHHFILEELRDALEPALKYAVDLIYFNQDADETFQYLEGNAADIISLSDAVALRQLPINVRILLARAKRLELREAALSAIPQAQGFYQLLQVSPEAAKKLLPLYIQALRGMEIENADQIFPTEHEIDAMLQAQQDQLAASLRLKPSGQPTADVSVANPDAEQGVAA